MLLREYETIYILKPDITDENINQVNKRLMNVFENDEGHVLRQSTWGKKKLAFELKKQQKGIYYHLRYLSKPTMIQELERNLRMLEPVLAYQTIKLATDVDAEKRLAEIEQEKKAQSAKLEAEKEAEKEAKKEAEKEAKKEPEKAQAEDNNAELNKQKTDNIETDSSDSPEAEKEELTPEQDS